MKLFTTDDLEIVSILLNDGTSSEFSFSGSIKNGEPSVIYKLPKGRDAEVSKKNGDLILIDSKGNRWLATEIECHNAGNFKNR